jgi:hypothetical protein
MGTATATSSVEFDNLTRRYALTRTVDGHLVDSRQTEDEAAVRLWTTPWCGCRSSRPTFSSRTASTTCTVRASARPGNGSILWPFGSSSSAQAKFTFVR